MENYDEVAETALSAADSMEEVAAASGYKQRFLSYLSCGFNVRDSCDLSGVAERTVKFWKQTDPEFKELITTRLPELRKKHSNKFLETEYIRNYRMFLKKDYDLLTRDTEDKPYTSAENAYLKTARGHYTPQQLQALQQLDKAIDAAGGDFVQMIMERTDRLRLIVSNNETSDEKNSQDTSDTAY